VSIDPEKLIFILIVAVLVLGPDRLPQAARTMGRIIGEVRRYTSAFQSEVKDVLAEPRAIIDAAVHDAEMRSHLESRNGTAATGDAQAPARNGAASVGAVDDADGPSGGDGASGAEGPVNAGAGRSNPGPGRPDRGTPEPRTTSLAGAPDDPALN
jgi:sec-independent protein translocase protein TatB